MPAKNIRIIKTNRAVDLNRKRKKILAAKKLHSFEWNLPMDIHAKDYMLIKGVAATEGTFKSTDKFSRDNLAHGTGALSMAAAMGMSVLNIDHYSSEPLPVKYGAKYAGIGSEGICGAVLDADMADNLVSGKKLAQTEFVGYVTNKVVYNLIVSGKVKGCSVEDMQRRTVCDCGEDEASCECTIEGSRFVNIGLILEEVPDSHGTWVAPVTEDDLIMWKNNKKNSDGGMMLLTTKHKQHYNIIKRAARLINKSLEDYMNEDGSFIQGKLSIIEYLMEEKELSDIDSKHLADFLYKNPKILSSFQLEGMSGMDLMAWFSHIIRERMMRKKKKHVDINEDGSCPDGFQLSEDGTMCVETIVSESHQAPNEDGTCNEGFKLSEDGTECIKMEKHEALNEDGSCPEGFELSEDGTECIEIQSSAMHPTPDENGKCPEGFTLSEDGTECIEISSRLKHKPLNEDGSCPDGFQLTEDSTECVMINSKTKHQAPLEDGTCPQGFELSEDGSMCIEIKSRVKHQPPNPDGTCSEGWKLSEDGTECIKIMSKVKHQVPNEDGTCPEGFELSEDGSKCIETNSRAEHQPVNEDGTCNEGFQLSEDGSTCIEVVMSEIETAAPLEDGTCPEGWNLSEDGTQCVRQKLEQNQEEIPDPVPDENGKCPEGWSISGDGLTCIIDEPQIIDMNKATHKFRKRSATAIIKKGVNSQQLSGVEILDDEKFEMIIPSEVLPHVRNPQGIYGRTIPLRLAEKWRKQLIHALETIEYLQKKTD